MGGFFYTFTLSLSVLIPDQKTDSWARACNLVSETMGLDLNSSVFSYIVHISNLSLMTHLERPDGPE
jgi:hypothetical protein